jgi:hypothetical protein
MTSASSVRGQARRHASISGNGAATGAVPRPHIFCPVEQAADSDRYAHFNLRARPGYYCAEARRALLRREKYAPHDELLVDFSGPQVTVELAAADVPLVRGVWSWRAAAGGEALSAAGEWGEVCWHREEACDYLEIELPLAGGWKIERQMVLARQDRFLFLADALLGPTADPVEIRYEQALPLASEVGVDGTKETRELTILKHGRNRATVLPLALSEWRAEFCHAELTAGGDRLELAQAALGRSLYSPLWIDLDPRRRKQPITWRRLTVGENLAVVQRDVAAGYRVQAGRQQWLIYRSLTPFGNRSVLGHNTAYSFVCGRIKKDGGFDPIVEIE